MKFIGKTKYAQLKEEEKKDYVEITDEAEAITEAIKRGFSKWRMQAR